MNRTLTELTDFVQKLMTTEPEPEHGETVREARNRLLERTKKARDEYEDIIKQLEEARTKIDPGDPNADLQTEAVVICLTAARKDLRKIEDAHDKLLNSKRRYDPDG